jgi:hypothetical protein
MRSPGASMPPIDLARLGGLERPVVRARYGYADAGAPTLAELVMQRLEAARR